MTREQRREKCAITAGAYLVNKILEQNCSPTTPCLGATVVHIIFLISKYIDTLTEVPKFDRQRAATAVFRTLQSQPLEAPIFGIQCWELIDLIRDEIPNCPDCQFPFGRNPKCLTCVSIAHIHNMGNADNARTWN